MSYFPLRVNTAGVIPPIFASSLLMFPLHDRAVHRSLADDRVATLLRQDYLDSGRLALQRVYVALIIFFAFFYTAIVINPTTSPTTSSARAASSRASGPASSTAEYIDRLLVAPHPGRRGLRLGDLRAAGAALDLHAACRSTSAAPRC